MTQSDMQSGHCCCCVTGVFATLFGTIFFAVGVCFILNYGINDIALPPQWQTLDAKKTLGIILLCTGIVSLIVGILVSVLFFTICHSSHEPSFKERQVSHVTQVHKKHSNGNIPHRRSSTPKATGSVVAFQDERPAHKHKKHKHHRKSRRRVETIQTIREHPDEPGIALTDFRKRHMMIPGITVSPSPDIGSDNLAMDDPSECTETNSSIGNESFEDARTMTPLPVIPGSIPAVHYSSRHAQSEQERLDEDISSILR